MSTGRSVLVVDDNESTRFVFARWLRRAGFDVDEAVSGGEALRAVASTRYDLVILDVNLPDMTGPDVCELIKGDPLTEATPVLHVSATAVETTDRTAGLRRGADAYLVEPLEREELLASVGALIRLSDARRQAEVLAARLNWLHSTALELNAASDVEVLVTIAARAAARLRGALAVSGVLSDAGATLAVSIADDRELTIEISNEEFNALAADPVPILRRVAPGVFRDDHELRTLTAGVRSHRLAALLATRAWSEEDDHGLTAVLHQLAQTVAVAGENLHLFAREHDIALTLQHSLLGSVPNIPWLDIAVRYVPSSKHVEIGGDFYDVVQLDDGAVGLVVGDVQGHSLHAATVMATLRNSLGAYLLAGHGPGEALRLLNRVLERSNPDITATVCCTVLQRDGSAVVANAGHIPPIVLIGESASFLPVTGTLLGIEGEPNELVTELPVGGVLVQFTDGLVERRDKPLDLDLTSAARSIEGMGSDPDELCDHLLRQVGPSANYDDIAILVVRRSST